MKARKTRQIKFIVLIIILAIIVITFSLYSLVFIFVNLEKALGTEEVKETRPVKFEIERFENLKLIK